MLKVAGSNLFGQWFLKDHIFDHFREINKEEINIFQQVLIRWAYNVFVIDEKLYISGAFKGKESQFIEIDIPEDFEHLNYLISGNDYHLVIVSGTNICMFDLHLGQSRKIKLVESVHEGDTFENKIVKVVMTNNSCIYLTNNGDAYCGLLPILIDTSVIEGKVIDVAVGYEHNILLMDNGTLYTWGNGRRLQLGHGDLHNLDVPTEVKALAGIKITKICAGGWHSCAISEYGDLYVWGWNDTGQLGVKEKSSEDNNSSLQSYGLPILVDLYDENGKEIDFNVKDVACGSRHTAILLDDGSVWTSGCNKYGQLGFCVNNVDKVDCFRKSYSNASVLLCGLWSTVIK